MPPMCFYVNCPNKGETHSMFRFPINDKERLQMWIKNSGNSHLSHLSADKWKYRYLCILHFDSSIIQENQQRTRIVGPAIPKHYNGEEETIDMVAEACSTDSKVMPFNEGKNRGTDCDYNCEDEAMDVNSHNVINLKRTAVENSSMALTLLPPQKVYQKRPLDTLEGQKKGCSSSQNSLQLTHEWNMSSMKQQKLGNNCIDVEHVKTRKLVQASRKTTEDKFPSKNAKILSCMQLRGKATKWKKGEKRFSLSLYRRHPDCYRFLIDIGIVLPPVAIIKRWLSESCLPGLTKEDYDASGSVKEEPVEECEASVEEREESGASLKQEPEEDYGANVKEENSDAAYFYAEHEFAVDVGSELLQRQDALTLLSTASGESSKEGKGECRERGSTRWD